MENSIGKLATIYLRENYFQLLNVSLLKFVVIFYIYIYIYCNITLRGIDQ